MGLWKQIVGATREVSNYRERLITSREADQARKVFQATLPYGAIWLSNGLGFGQRPYAIPHPTRWGSYLIHFGPADFDNVVGTIAAERSFIHELTHVWQGHNSRFPFGYIFNSIWHQAAAGGGAYSYTVGKAWSEYNCEQQGNIVRDWWSPNQNSIGGKQSDPRFRYIRDNIRGLQS
ncbi:MAG: hypothetical protein ACRD68_09325, partial [Pyrinomonadaceae bacterium]